MQQLIPFPTLNFLFVFVLRHHFDSRKWDSSSFPTNQSSGSQADLLQQSGWNGNMGVELFGLVTSCCLLEEQEHNVLISQPIMTWFRYNQTSKLTNEKQIVQH